MRFFRSRPGRLEPTPPLAAPALSRRQLELSVSGDKMSVKRAGKCPLRVNGVEHDAAVIAPGTTLAFGQELVLQCVLRPACPAPLLHWPAAETPVFGEVDRFGIVGEAPATWQIRDDVAFAAKSGQHVLLLGESGTGKELAAHAIHRLSSRASRTFVARNASTLPAGLIDAEVFGNVRNYPNPGMAERPGLIGQADGGFLFLDEIAELPLELQTHLLRVLDQRGEYQRLGEASMRRSDFRVIAATNRAPDELRHDFLARFPVRIELPPLRERREDIGLVVRHLALKAIGADAELKGRFCELAADGKTLLKMDSRLVDWMLRGESPANVRDLAARLWKAMATSKGAAIGYTDELEVLARASVPPQPDDTAQANSRPRNREPTLVEIREALQLAQGNVARAAQGLGLSSRYALYRILRKHSVESIDGVN